MIKTNFILSEETMAYLDEFHRVVGETILECQRIEHDIKLIYAGMLKGNLDSNIKIVENKSLGTVLALLKTLDNSDQKPYFHQEDYSLLYEIKDIRNWLVHKSYMEFVYLKGAQWDDIYQQNRQKLLNFNARMCNLANTVEDIRLKIMEMYNRA